MGKRRKRLTMAKYAKKYASIRATIARLQGVVEEAMADDVITEQEQVEIEAAEAEVAAVLQTDSPTVPESPVVEEESKPPVEAKKPSLTKKKKAPKRKTTSSTASKRKPKVETVSPD